MKQIDIYQKKIDNFKIELQESNPSNNDCSGLIDDIDKYKQIVVKNIDKVVCLKNYVSSKIEKFKHKDFLRSLLHLPDSKNETFEIGQIVKIVKNKKNILCLDYEKYNLNYSVNLNRFIHNSDTTTEGKIINSSFDKSILLVYFDDNNIYWFHKSDLEPSNLKSSESIPQSGGKKKKKHTFKKLNKKNIIKKFTNKTGGTCQNCDKMTEFLLPIFVGYNCSIDDSEPENSEFEDDNSDNSVYIPVSNIQGKEINGGKINKKKSNHYLNKFKKKKNKIILNGGVNTEKIPQLYNEIEMKNDDEQQNCESSYSLPFNILDIQNNLKFSIAMFTEFMKIISKNPKFKLMYYVIINIIYKFIKITIKVVNELINIKNNKINGYNEYFLILSTPLCISSEFFINKPLLESINGKLLKLCQILNISVITDINNYIFRIADKMTETIYMICELRSEVERYKLK